LNIHPVKKFAKTRITIAAFLIFLFTGEIGMFADFLTGFIGNCELKIGNFLIIVSVQAPEQSLLI